MLLAVARRFWRRPAAVVGLTLFAVMTLAGLIAPLVSPYEPTAIDLEVVLNAPSGDHWLGTDDVGRDVFTRMLYGIRITVQAALIAVAIGAGVGIPVGLISGYRRGLTDDFLMRFNDALMSFPALVLAVVIIGFLGPNLVNAMIAIGIVYTPRFVRVTRGLMLSIREEEFILAAHASGCSTARVIVRHALPNMAPTLIVETTLLLGLAILAEASLSFLGLGVQPPDASLGAMVGRGYSYLGRAPVFVIAPGLAIVLLVSTFNLLGDALDRAIGDTLGGAVDAGPEVAR